MLPELRNTTVSRLPPHARPHIAHRPGRALSLASSRHRGISSDTSAGGVFLLRDVLCVRHDSRNPHRTKPWAKADGSPYVPKYAGLLLPGTFANRKTWPS